MHSRSRLTMVRRDPSIDPGTRRGERGLDWFSFFCANLQTGFGPFVSVYLTTSKWTQTDIGLVLMVGGLVGLIGQIPGGALVDRTRSKALIAGLSVAAIGIAALCVALSAFFPVILFAWVLHAAASCVLSPSIATVSLGLVGYSRIGQRLGRNATFASVGSALAAAGMGAVGYSISNQAVFFVTALLAASAPPLPSDAASEKRF
jgi:MFS family permease